MSESFPKKMRLLKPTQFADAQRGWVATDSMLVLKVIWRSQPGSRLGLAIGRQVGNAVVRNRWKRLIREAFRRNQSVIPGNLDLVVRPRNGAVPEYQAVAKSLIELTRRAAKRLTPKSTL